MFLKNEIIKEIVEKLRNSELIVYPTDTVYGLGADGTSEQAVKKVYEIKQRPLEMPISVLVSDFEMLERYAEITEEQMKILKESLPGPYTFILKPKTKLPVAKNNVGFRIPDHCCTLIAKEFGKPITTTSANIHKQPTPPEISAIKNIFKESVSLYIDEGTKQGKPSTVIDLTQGQKVIRK
jgi:L-threonylcarbamoyladenylate synthase